MEKIPATVGILTFNSGGTLRRALESVRAFDDIVLCDGGSTDDTLAIAIEYGARVIKQDAQFQNENGTLRDYAGVRNQCVEVARHDWFFYIDSDECASDELVAEVRSIVATEKPPHLVYSISPRIMLDGNRIDHSSNYPGWQKRFFNRKSGARFRKAVHERIGYDEVAHPAGYLKHPWFYYISSVQDGVKNRKYAYMDAEHRATRNFLQLLALVGKRLLTLAKTTLKILLLQLLHPGKGTLPLSLEFTRIQYHLYFIQALVARYFGKTP